ncbi:hypothetical protein EBR77_01585 [bacterium]|nr:hypothetical protein [bacterium]NBX78618.1 hypothetical protein [bacterium]
MKKYIVFFALTAGFVSIQAQIFPTKNKQDLWVEAVRQLLGLSKSKEKRYQDCGLKQSEAAYIEALLGILRGSL